jgi:hypothetical protein
MLAKLLVKRFLKCSPQLAATSAVLGVNIFPLPHRHSPALHQHNLLAIKSSMAFSTTALTDAG